MTSSSGYHEQPQQGPERSRSSRRDCGGQQDAGLTELLVLAPTRHSPDASAPYEDEARNARQKSLNGYSYAALSEEIAPKPTSTSQQSGERSLEEEQVRATGSNGCLVSGRATRQTADNDGQGENQTRSPHSASATRLYTISHLVFFSILGTLARLGVEAITSYPSVPVTPSVLWPNLGGSLALGFLLEDRRIFREEWGRFSCSEEWSFHPAALESEDADRVQHAFRNHGKVKKTIPLFIGLATGFCGCFTSFSSFIRDAFLALVNGLPSLSSDPMAIPPRSGGYSFEAVLAILIVHTAVSLSALKVGAHIALALESITPTLPFKTIRKILDPLTVFLGFGSWIGAMFLTAFPLQPYWRGRVTYALAFAPLGCLLRFYASKNLNPLIPSFPLGTFAVNIFGTIILGMCFDLQHSMAIAEDIMSCQVLQGVMEGFCGCTTTVSTWVAELNGLRRGHAYVYGLTSVAAGVLFLIVIMGTLQWSHGFQRPVCV